MLIKLDQEDVMRVRNPMAVAAKAQRATVVRAKKGKGSYSRKGRQPRAA